MKVQRRIDNYELGRMLGKGHYGHVRLATRNGEQYAIKYMKKQNKQFCYFIDYLLAKESIIKDFKHKNILQIYAASANGTYIKRIKKEQQEIKVAYVVLQYAPNGDLFGFIASSNGLTEEAARYFFDHIADAIRYLHSKGIVHRDIKLENILLDENYNPLICDFGLSRKLSEIGFITNDIRDRVGTVHCMSPELLADKMHSPVKDDIFTLGHILFMMVARHQPFHKASSEDPYYRLIRFNLFHEYWNIIDRFHAPKWCTDEFKSLVTAMLNYEMVFRPSLTEIEEHSWMRECRLYTPEELRAEIENSFTRTLVEQESKAKKRKKRKLEEEEKWIKICSMPEPMYLSDSSSSTEKVENSEEEMINEIDVDMEDVRGSMTSNLKVNEKKEKKENQKEDKKKEKIGKDTIPVKNFGKAIDSKQIKKADERLNKRLKKEVKKEQSEDEEEQSEDEEEQVMIETEESKSEKSKPLEAEMERLSINEPLLMGMPTYSPKPKVKAPKSPDKTYREEALDEFLETPKQYSKVMKRSPRVSKERIPEKILDEDQEEDPKKIPKKIPKRTPEKPPKEYKKIEHLKPTMLLTQEDISKIESILTHFFDPKCNKQIKFTENIEGVKDLSLSINIKNLIASIKHVKKDDYKNKVVLIMMLVSCEVWKRF